MPAKTINIRDEKRIAGPRNIAKTGIFTCALGTLGRVKSRWSETNESLCFLIFGITVRSLQELLLQLKTDEGAWQTMPLLLRQQLLPCGGRRILLA
jgi:hypothetical protein